MEFKDWNSSCFSFRLGRLLVEKLKISKVQINIVPNRRQIQFKLQLRLLNEIVK
jgi:hypothetical protein